jgi:hypothetical protein
MKEKIGLILGTISTITLSDVNLLLGILSGLLMLLCLGPKAVKSWREMLTDFYTICENEKTKANFANFIGYTIARLRSPSSEKPGNKS